MKIMNKQEKIQESYGVYWESVKDYVDENGWCNCRVAHELAISGNQEDSDCGHLVRPNSIQGVEDNNGWIKIENENDLPKLQERYFAVKNDGGIIQVFFYGKASNWMGNITHYQPIIKPEPPIY